MNEFAAPSGPPPPKVPEGWKAQWSEEWKEWFFVDLSTGISTWEKPTAPALPTYSKPLERPPFASNIGSGGVGGAGAGPLIPGEKGSTLYSNNPYNTTTTSSSTTNDINADARLAQELQAEEDARARSSAPNQNYQTSPPFQQSALQQQGLGPQYLPPRETKRSSGLSGLLSKLTGKSGGGHGGHQQAGYGYQQQQEQQQQGYVGYPQRLGGGAYGSGGGYGGGGGYGYQGGGMMPPRRRPGAGAGMGMAGAGALGLGAGLVGGAMLADGGDGGGDGGGDYGGGDGGGDYGGGDYGGGDYGGGDGGGDYGGGDGGGGDGGGGD